METCNHIYLQRGGCCLDTYQDMQGALYYQSIICGCRNRDRRAALAGNFEKFQLFYDTLTGDGFREITKEQFQRATM